MTPSKSKIIKFAVNEEDTEYVDSIRVFNIKISLKSIIREILPDLKKEYKLWLKEFIEARGKAGSKSRQLLYRNFIKYLQQKYGKDT